MFTRLRWFIYGASAAIAAGILVIVRARALREKLDARGVARVTVDLTADGLEAAGRRLQRSAIRIAPDGSSGRHG